MRRGADAVVRDICETIIVDGSSLIRHKQVVCQSSPPTVSTRVTHAVKRSTAFDRHDEWGAGQMILRFIFFFRPHADFYFAGWEGRKGRKGDQRTSHGNCRAAVRFSGAIPIRLGVYRTVGKAISLQFQPFLYQREQTVLIKQQRIHLRLSRLWNGANLPMRITLLDAGSQEI